jgi:hypothetical protein
LTPPSLEDTARELSDHEGMSPHFAVAQAIRQEVIAAAEVVDPDGGVDEHYPRRAGRRRGTDFKRRS